jgi:hypothetical protein
MELLKLLNYDFLLWEGFWDVFHNHNVIEMTFSLIFWILFLSSVIFGILKYVDFSEHNQGLKES